MAVLSVEDRVFVFDLPSAAVVRAFGSPKPPEESYFGVSVAIDGGLGAVGAPAEDLVGEEAASPSPSGT